MVDSFPRQAARTRQFTLGAPRDVTVSPDGSRVVFLRSSGPEDPVNALWVLDLPDGDERCVADPRALGARSLDDLPAEERARRERARELASGITAYAADREVRRAAAAVGGELLVVDLVAGGGSILPVPGPVIDPRPDPTGARVAWSDGAAMWVADLDAPRGARTVAAPERPEERWGVAEFLAAEEMDRTRGYWWAPDGTALLVARVDEEPVTTWWISDPAQPAAAPTAVRYPAAGTANATVGLWILGLDGQRTEVRWDAEAWPYVVEAGWDAHGPLVAVQPRDQRALRVLGVDLASGATEVLWEDHDEVWVERAPGTPTRLEDGRLLVCSDRAGVRQLIVDGTAVTPEHLNVRAVLHVGAGEALVSANPVDDATGVDVWRWSDAGIEPMTTGDGVHWATAGGRTLAVRSRSLEFTGSRVAVLHPPAGEEEGPNVAPGVRVLRSSAAAPPLEPRPVLHHLGPRRLPVALLLPADAEPGTPLPVLLDPYGGPHAQRVVQARDAYATSQWFADQGFAVVVVDGRGTPGRGAAWERAVSGDFATSVLEDQVDGLHHLAEVEPRLDLGRVAIRGWSFGGYLAALAVLRRPDVVHAAIAGAPVTDWRLYDTFYTERYLGHPEEAGAAYDRSSLLDDAAALDRPLLLIHGLADDNVVAAHTLRLSSALLAAGRPHRVLPLTGVTHMLSQEDVAERLLELQVAFLREALELA